MPLSPRTLGLLSKPFDHGEGPTHDTIDLIFASAGADACLPPEGSKLNRVLAGLKKLQDQASDLFHPSNPGAEKRLHQVVSELAELLMQEPHVDAGRLEAALTTDGFATYGRDQSKDEPADKLATFLLEVFGDRRAFKVARRHYEVATRAFDRDDWEAANSQFRSACDAAFDALAQTKGCPNSKKGGAARKWLEEKGHLERDEGELIKAFMAFAGRDGSHAGISDQAESQLRRHIATALITFAVLKLDEGGDEMLALL